MDGVALDEDSAQATISCGKRNLATLAGHIFRGGGSACPMVRGIDLRTMLSNRAPADYDTPDGRSQAWYDRHLSWEEDQPAAKFAAWSAEASFDCLVCGSRGGQVTLPALWLLGLRMPAVVVNAGCVRAEVAWAWPAG